VWWPAHDRARRPPRGSCVARGAGEQWVLSLPPQVRYLLAWRHDLCTAVAGVLHRAVQRHLRSWARTRGLGDARSGAVIVVQRFGGALNLNVHFHALMLDGVFVRARLSREGLDDDGELRGALLRRLLPRPRLVRRGAAASAQVAANSVRKAGSIN
jgi:Putative transposase